jgi:Leucine-rich repeat (LRR) protein
MNSFSNLLTSLDLSSCSNLYLVNVAYNELTDLNVSVCPGLVALLCSYNQLAALSMSGFGELRYVNCRSNRIAALDLSGCTQLTYLDCRTNELTDLSSLVTNALQGGLGAGDQVYLSGNPLSDFAVTSQIPYLQSRGVTVFWP